MLFFCMHELFCCQIFKTISAAHVEVFTYMYKISLICAAAAHIRKFDHFDEMGDKSTFLVILTSFQGGPNFQSDDE